MHTEKATIVEIFSFSLRILGFWFYRQRSDNVVGIIARFRHCKCIESYLFAFSSMPSFTPRPNVSRMLSSSSYQPIWLLCVRLCRLKQSLNIYLTSFYYVQISSSCYLAIRFKFHFKIRNRCHRFRFIFSQHHLDNVRLQ